ncbi:MAG: hypothetical protein JOY70_00555 [Acidisphaera sp.]|nr:hypothetical protein [Acidisphaera sp.]
MAAECNVTVEDAIRAALEVCAMAAREAARLRDRSPEAMAMRRARMDEAARDIAAMPVLDPRPPREIMDELNAV